MARRRSGKKIDFVHWTGFTGSSGAQGAGSICATLNAASHEPETLLRIRGEASVFLDTTQAPGGRALITMGIILVPEGTGTTGLWTPFTDPDAPWIWFWSTVIGYEEMVTDVVDVPIMTAARMVIDNKAMRIVRNQEIQFCVENTTLGGAVSVNSDINGRFLSGT